jgi:hypothetical protein
MAQFRANDLMTEADSLGGTIDTTINSYDGLSL